MSTYNSPLREEQSEQTRERILRGVADALAAGTTDELTIPVIARTAGVSTRTIYRHFPSRDALFDEWIRWARRNVDLFVESYPERLEDIPAAAAGLYEHYEKNETLLRAMLTDTGRELRVRTRRKRARAIDAAVDEGLSDFDAQDRRLIRAVIYLLVSAPAWQAMRDQTGISGREAGVAAAWALEVLIRELQTRPQEVREALTRDDQTKGTRT